MDAAARVWVISVALTVPVTVSGVSGVSVSGMERSLLGTADHTGRTTGCPNELSCDYVLSAANADMFQRVARSGSRSVWPLNSMW